MNKPKLKRLLNKLSSLEDSLSRENVSMVEKSLDEAFNGLSNQLNESFSSKFLDKVESKLEDLKEKVKLEPIIVSISELQNTVTELQSHFESELENGSNALENTRSEVNELISRLKGSIDEASGKEFSDIATKISNLEERLSSQDLFSTQQKDSFSKTFSDVEKRLEIIHSKLDLSTEENNTSRQTLDTGIKDANIGLKKALEDIEKLRKEFVTKFSNIRGGNANRQININSSVMSMMFTDINFKNSTSIGWTASNDATNKRVDIVASVLAGGGGGAGNPAGNNSEVQYNDAGSFGASSTFSWDKNASVLAVNKKIRVNTGNGILSLVDLTGAGTTDAGYQLEGGNGLFSALFTELTGSILSLGINVTQIGGRDTAKPGWIFRLDDRATGTLGDYDNFVIKNVPAGGAETNRFVVQGAGSVLANGPFLPFTNDVAALGSSTNRWGDLFLANGAVIDYSDVKVTHSASLLTIGTQGSVRGALSFAGLTTGTVTVQPASTAGNWTMTLPPNTGTANFVMTTDGNGVATWASVAASGSGITRSTSIITANTTGGTTAATDYLYFANAGMTFTLPTAVGNSNMYTVKNMANTSVLVSTSAGQDIDGSATVLLTTQYQALNFLSNGSVWGVT